MIRKRAKAATRTDGTPSRRRVAHTFFPIWWRQRRTLAASYSCSLMAVGAVVLAPWPVKFIIDHVLGDRPFPGWLAGLYLGASPESTVILFATTAAIVAALGAIFSAKGKNLDARIRERMTLDLRDHLLRHMQTLPLTLRTTHRSGELVLRLVDDTLQAVRLFTKTAPVIFRYLATIVVTFAVMFWLKPLLGLLGLAVVAVLAWLVRRYAGPLREASRRKRLREGKVAGLSQEIVHGMHSIQAQGIEELVRERYTSENARSLDAGVQETRVAVGMERIMQIVNGLAVALFVGGGSLLVLRDQLTVGELTVYVTYIIQLLKPVEKINELASSVARGFARTAQLCALLDYRPIVHDAPDAAHIGRARGELELKLVSFAYPSEETTEDKNVLTDVDLRLEPGTLTVLLGASGTGKSTLINLLLRLFDPASGEIFLDGIPYRRIQLQALRAQFAVMLQATHLFAGTVREALRSNCNGQTDKALWRVLEEVALQDFVSALSGGLDSVLGEDGVNLSGGQRARLSLARALLMGRPILLLDEPLANVDVESQTVICKTIERARAHCTCLAVSHQLALAARADRVVHLQNHRIVEPSAQGPRQAHLKSATGV